MYRYLFIILALIGLHYIFKEKVVTQPNGILITQEPLQETIHPFIIKSTSEYSITAMAKYDIQARILKKETYSWDKAAKFSPLDLALGWKQMSSNELLNTLTITQSNRFYFWSTKLPNYSRKMIEINSSNNHLIPENSNIKKQLEHFHEGELIEIKGYLVNVKDKNWFWNTSLTREDTGDGACEIIYVQSVEKLEH
jgi:hypothetical protein